jgi:hypothetical protein
MLSGHILRAYTIREQSYIVGGSYIHHMMRSCGLCCCRALDTDT